MLRSVITIGVDGKIVRTCYCLTCICIIHRISPSLNAVSLICVAAERLWRVQGTLKVLLQQMSGRFSSLSVRVIPIRMLNPGQGMGSW